MIIAAIRTALLESAYIASLIDTRIYPGVLPQGGILPAVTMQEISVDDNNTVNGLPNLRWTRLQFDVWADTYAEADKLMLAITNTINCKSFDYQDVRIASIVSMPGGGQSFESGVKIQRKMRDFGIWFEYKN